MIKDENKQFSVRPALYISAEKITLGLSNMIQIRGLSVCFVPVSEGVRHDHLCLPWLDVVQEASTFS